MRKVLFMFSTVVFGLLSVASASAGFVAGPNTRVALLNANYSSTSGLVNKFAVTSTPGTDKMITTVTNFTNTPGSFYSQLLGPGSFKVYLVAATGSTFGVAFTGNEDIKGIAASNGWNGNMLTNVWGSHLSLQSSVKTALEGFFGVSSALDTTASVLGVFGNGSQGIEIQNNGFAGNPDTYFKSQSALNGFVNSPGFGGVNGLNELSLVFTQVVPEPTTLGLFGIGTLMFGLARSRRKKS